MTPGNDENAENQSASAHKVSVVYRAGEGDPVTTVWRGVTFIKDKPVEFDESNERDLSIIEAARGNPSFDVDGEDKAQQRADDQQRRAIEEAEAELAVIDGEAEVLEQRHIAEANEMEARHSREREAFLNGREARAIELRRIIRGSDGSDDLYPADAPPDHPAPPAATGGQPVETPPPNQPPPEEPGPVTVAEQPNV